MDPKDKNWPSVKYVSIYLPFLSLKKDNFVQINYNCDCVVKKKKSIFVILTSFIKILCKDSMDM